MNPGAYFARLAADYSRMQSSMPLLRKAYAIYMLFIAGVPSYTWLAGTPSILFNPPVISISNLLQTWPDRWFFVLISLLLPLLYILLLFGIRIRFVSVMIFLFLLTGQSFAFSFGKIDHSFLMVLVPLVMAFSGWEKKPHQNGQEKAGMALMFMALFLGFGFLTAVIPKILGGWITSGYSGVQGYLISNFNLIARQDFLAETFMQIHSAAFWKVLDYMTVIFELGFFVSFWFPAWFRFSLFLAVIFHLFNLLVFNIAFAAHFSVYLLFVDWNKLAGADRTGLIEQIRSVPVYARMFLLSFLVYVSWYFCQISGNLYVKANPSLLNLIIGSFSPDARDYIFGIPVIFAATFIICIIAWSYLKNRRVSRVR